MSNGTNVPPSAGRRFYDQIISNANPVAFVRSLVNSTPPSYEEEWRDFKGGQATSESSPNLMTRRWTGYWRKSRVDRRDG
jgi:hypothetical protein